MEFKYIDHTDLFLSQVIELGKKNSQTLGLMPRDAYIQQARKKCIKNFLRKKAIVGCSYLNSVSIGGAKFLFSTFRRFGIYSWKEIFKLAKGNINHKIKVLQFSDTEVFEKTISFSETNRILEAQGFKKQTFVSPVKVSSKVFSEIYRLSKAK
ncbi:MAG: hypothetical protein KF803_10530 [Cyclobacteriaceae bacterium]|nr:hypothetical protein [Cyclobacteriaceae bacterium]